MPQQAERHEPASVNVILDIDATEIVEAIKNRQLTSLDVVKTFIRHIKKVNPRINAVVENGFQSAVEEAREKDRKLDEGTATGALFGVPISVKEAYDVAGMKTTGGLLKRKDVVANDDAEIVARLKKQGAIILGKTNTPELCFCQETENKLYGRTNNPWDVTRTAGGSSGGEGAVLAAGGAAVGIGSDIGGSIRFPSHFNGVVGFKPGKFQVSAAGHFARIDIPLQQRMLGLGPMGKSVRDMRLVYAIVADQEPAVKSHHDFKVDILPEDQPYPLSGTMGNILNEIARQLDSSYRTGREIPPYFTKSALLWQEMMSVDGGERVKDVALSDTDSGVYGAYVKEKTLKNAPIHAYLSWALIGARLFKPSAKRKAEIESMIEQGDKLLDGYLENRVLILPVYHTGAPEHGDLYKDIFSIRKTFMKYMPYSAYSNVWGLPSLTVPITDDEKGMPISVQLISRNGNEDALFQLGEILEQTFGGYSRCQQLD